MLCCIHLCVRYILGVSVLTSPPYALGDLAVKLPLPSLYVLFASLLPRAFAFCYSSPHALGVLGDLAVKLPLYFSVFSLCLCGKNVLYWFCILGNSLPHSRHAVAPFATRRLHESQPPICAISAPRSLTAAATKCQFSGYTGASRPPFRRIICEIRNRYNIIISTT